MNANKRSYQSTTNWREREGGKRESWKKEKQILQPFTANATELVSVSVAHGNKYSKGENSNICEFYTNLVPN